MRTLRLWSTQRTVWNSIQIIGNNRNSYSCVRLCDKQLLFIPRGAQRHSRKWEKQVIPLSHYPGAHHRSITRAFKAHLCKPSRTQSQQAKTHLVGVPLRTVLWEPQPHCLGGIWTCIMNYQHQLSTWNNAGEHFKLRDTTV